MSAVLVIYPLNGEGIEVPYTLDCDEVDIAMTLSIQDLQDVTKRRGSFSKTITLPGTPANNQAFGHAYNVQSFVGGFTPNKRIRAVLWDSGVQTFSGSLQLLSITKTGAKVNYEVGLFSEEIAFFRQINETLLVDTAGVSGFNHTLSPAAASGTWEATLGVGYVYGFIDSAGFSDTFPNLWQAWSNSLLVPFANLTPSFYVKQLVDLIFAQAGYRYQSTFFNSTRFKRLVLPYAGGSTLQGDISTFNSQAFAGGGLSDNSDNWPALTGTSYYEGIIPFDTVISDPTMYWDTSNYQFTNTGGYATFDAQCIFELKNLGDGRNIRFAFVDTATGVPLSQDKWTRSTQGILAGETKLFEFQERIRVAPNQTIDVRIYYQDFTDIYPITLQDGATISMVCVENTFGTLSANMLTALPPDITQADLLLDLQKMFNLYFYQAPEDPTLIYIEPFTSFYDTGAVDWSLKIDNDGEQFIQVGDPEARKSITFKYRDSGDALGKLYNQTFEGGYASREWQTDNYNAQGQQVVETKCATVIPASYNSGLVIGRTFDIDSNGAPKAKVPGYRIAQYNYVAIPSNAPWFLLTDLEPTFVPFTSIPFISHLDNPYSPTFDLAFGMPKQIYYRAFASGSVVDYTNTNLFNTYWRNYVIETTSKESLQIELDVMLDPVDVYRLDFRKPIYIMGVLFRLLEIKDYVVGGKTKCRAVLRRILNLTAPSTGLIPIKTYFDAADTTLDEQSPQITNPNVTE